MPLAVVFNILNLRAGVSKTLKRLLHRLVDNFKIAPTSKFFEFDNGKLRLNAGGIAIHYQPDGAGGSNNAHLGISEAILFSLLQRLVPHFACCLKQLFRAVLRINATWLDR